MVECDTCENDIDNALSFPRVGDCGNQQRFFCPHCAVTAAESTILILNDDDDDDDDMIIMTMVMMMATMLRSPSPSPVKYHDGHDQLVKVTNRKVCFEWRQHRVWGLDIAAEVAPLEQLTGGHPLKVDSDHLDPSHAQNAPDLSRSRGKSNTRKARLYADPTLPGYTPERTSFLLPNCTGPLQGPGSSRCRSLKLPKTTADHATIFAEYDGESEF